MGNEMVKEVDAKAMTEFLEDHKGMEAKSEKPQIQSAAYYFRKYVPEYDRQEKLSDVKTKSLGQVNENTVEKPKPEKRGLGSWIQDNPLESLLIGALIGGGIYALYKHYNKDEETETKNKSKKGKEEKKKKRKSLKELWEEKDIENENPSSDQSENEGQEELNEAEDNESSYSDEKTESISRRDLGIGITAAIGGSILGAALGDASLIAGIPVAIAGICKSSLGITMAGAGMALAIGYNTKEKEEEQGDLIFRSLKRISNYLQNLFDNILGLFIREEKPKPGDQKTMLGYIPASKIKNRIKFQ
jgi:hypothetical protein